MKHTCFLQKENTNFPLILLTLTGKQNSCAYLVFLR